MGCTSSSSMEDETKSPPTLAFNSHLSSNSFVTAKNGSLYLDDQLFRFASFNAPELFDGDVNGQFEYEDTMDTFSAPGAFGRAVTRTYTLRVKSKNIQRGHINGWSQEWGDWIWDEARLVEIDHVLAAAALRGVKLIIPIINQDFGGEDTNWVGNTTDLIRHRKGISSYEEAKKIDWWTDPEMIESFKLIIDKLLNRVNTINGRQLKSDNTVLAFETGNEMNFLGYRPAPASWTLIIAKHIKSLAPNTLVMDGSFARTDVIESCYAKEVLESPDVDILSYHYYGSGDVRRVKKDIEMVKRAGKVFVAGEYGFFDRPEDYSTFLANVDSAGGSGSLVWSLRPHSSRGGFKTHGEGNSIYSYHVPGWSPPPHPEFSASEHEIVKMIRTASFKILKLPIPAYPTPSSPKKLWFDYQTSKVHWLGAAWAERYLLDDGNGSGELKEVWDCTKEGEAGFALREARQGRIVKVRSVGVGGAQSEWSEELRI